MLVCLGGAIVLRCLGMHLAAFAGCHSCNLTYSKVGVRDVSLVHPCGAVPPKGLGDQLEGKLGVFLDMAATTTSVIQDAAGILCLASS